MSQSPVPDTDVVQDIPLGRGLIVMVLLWSRISCAIFLGFCPFFL